MPNIAYLNRGKLYLKRAGKAKQPIESEFAQGMIERDERQRSKDKWKEGSAGWNATGIGQAQMLAAAMDGNTHARRIHITAVARDAEPGKLLYALDTDAVGGLFQYDLVASHERRLVHKADLRLHDLKRHPEDNLIACTLRYPDGTANLGTMKADGGRLREITEGDSIDEAPSWVHGFGRRLVYQSAGVARNQAGYVAATAPRLIELLNLDRGELDTLYEDERFDCLLPQYTEDDVLYFIRRPYKPDGHHHVGIKTILRDIVMFPVGLVLTIFGILDYLSLLVRGKGLKTAGGPKKEGPTDAQLQLWGRMVDAEKARENAKGEKTPTLVPKDWVLVRKDDTGEEHELQEGVAFYDLTLGDDGKPDGGYVYTNGSTAFHISPSGKRSQLCTDSLIERVVVLDNA